MVVPLTIQAVASHSDSWPRHSILMLTSLAWTWIKSNFPLFFHGINEQRLPPILLLCSEVSLLLRSWRATGGGGYGMQMNDELKTIWQLRWNGLVQEQSNVEGAVTNFSFWFLLLRVLILKPMDDNLWMWIWLIGHGCQSDWYDMDARIRVEDRGFFLLIKGGSIVGPKYILSFFACAHWIFVDHVFLWHLIVVVRPLMAPQNECAVPLCLFIGSK